MNKTQQHETEGNRDVFADKTSMEVGVCCHNVTLCCSKVKGRSQVAALEYKLKNRQKKFGVDYLSLVERNASQQELKRCLGNAMEEIEYLQDEINRHLDSIQGGEEQVQDPCKSAREHIPGKDQVEDTNSNKMETERPLFTIDSDEDESYGPDQSPKASKKKKKKKKKTIAS
jgi:hypothetical protein